MIVILLRDLDAEPLTGIAGLRDRNADGRRELLLSLAAAEGHDDQSGKALLVHGFAWPAGVQTLLEIDDLVPFGRGLTLRGALRKSEGTLANGQSLGDIDGDGRLTTWCSAPAPARPASASSPTARALSCCADQRCRN